ncbi:MAG: hypothetical protein V4787_01100 [Pseudomonadota bacterium]
MTAALIDIQARVHECERPGMLEAAAQLRECLASASGSASAFDVKLTFAPADEAPENLAASTVFVLSLLPELDRPDEPVADTAKRWTRTVQALREAGSPVYVRNVFRHVQERTRDGRPTPVLDRIRRLDRMLVTASSQTGCAVIDIDRAFADIGARELGTDYRMGGPLAAMLAGHTTVLSFLSHGMDDIVDPAVQEKAKSLHGRLRDARTLIQHRNSSK